MMELIMLGFSIALGFALFSIAMTLFFYAIFGIFWLGAWVLGKIIGKDLLQ